MSPFNAIEITYYKDMPIDATLDVCFEVDVPKGWVFVRSYKSATKCSYAGLGDNVRVIRRVA